MFVRVSVEFRASRGNRWRRVLDTLCETEVMCLVKRSLESSMSLSFVPTYWFVTKLITGNTVRSLQSICSHYVNYTGVLHDFNDIYAKHMCKSEVHGICFVYVFVSLVVLLISWVNTSRGKLMPPCCSLYLD